MKKNIGYTLAIIGTLLLVLFIFYPPLYVYRVFFLQEADYDDYKRFKSIAIAKADKPFRFIKGSKAQEITLVAELEEQAVCKQYVNRREAAARI